MIVEFRFRNFRSFRDLQTLSFVATADTSHPDNVTAAPQIGDKRLVRAAVIYGANASGKSNIIAALDFLRDFVRNSGARKPGEPIPVQPFRLDEHSEYQPSEFELTFINDGVRYIYAVAVDHERVHRESLIAYPQGLPQTWFEREYDPVLGSTRYKFGSRLHGEKKRLQNLTRDDVPFLTIAATFNHAQLGAIYHYFSFGLQILPAGQAPDTERYEQFTASISSEQEAIRREVTALLQLADLGVQDFTVERFDLEHRTLPDILNPQTLYSLTPEEQQGMRQWLSVEVRLRHKSGKQSRQLVEFPFSDESLGTRRLFALSGVWLLSLLYGSTSAIDELDSSLHPLLVVALLGMYFNPAYNRKEAQLLFNTHDTTLLDTAFLRRDQIWFVEKDQEGASHLYPLSDFSARKDGALARGYLRGRYGAIPFIDFSADEDLFSAETQGQ
jgi:hypothetical protein